MKSEDSRTCTVKGIKKVDTRKYQKSAEMISALANGSRIAILDIMLEYGEVCACDLEIALGLPQPTVTSHLHKLYEVGLLLRREKWKFTYYSINPRHSDLIWDVLEK